MSSWQRRSRWPYLAKTFSLWPVSGLIIQASGLQRSHPLHPTLDTRAAAQYLGISLRTVHRLIQRGDLPIVHIGRRTIVRKEALDEFLRAHEHRRGMNADQG
jgi:excisionase family DNA binding protein